MTDDPTPVPASDGKLPTGYAVPAGMRWGLWDVALGIVVFLTLLGGVSLVAVLSPLRAFTLDHLDLVNFITALIAYGGLVAVIIVASRRSGLRSLGEDFGLRFRAVDIGIGLGIGIIGRIFTLLLTAITISITGYTPPRGNFELSTEPLWIVLNGVLIAALVAPVVEELFFRGLLLRAVRNTVLRWRRREQPADAATQKRAFILAIAISSIAFAAMHMYQAENVTFAVILGGSTLFVGVVNAFAALITHRLGGAIIGHVVFNGGGVLLSALAMGAG